MSSEVDKEIEAIKTVLGALTPLPTDVRDNVLTYVLKRLGLAVAPPSLPNAPTPPVPPQPPGSAPTPPATHIKDLRVQKRPRSANEMAALVAYFLANLAPESERKQSVSTKDIETYFKIGEFPLPDQIRNTLANAKNAGYFDTIGDGEYRLNAVGHNLVVHSMPRGGSPSETPRARKRKSSRKPQPSSVKAE